MKLFKKVAFTVISTVLAGTMAFSLAACNNEEQEEVPPHETHTQSVLWEKDETNHWKTCQEGGEKLEDTVAAHDWENDEDTVCDTCGYKRVLPHTDHTPAAGWGKNAAQHWQICEEGGEELSGTRADHVWENDSDPLCDTCGYIREIKTEYTFSAPEYKGVYDWLQQSNAMLFTGGMTMSSSDIEYDQVVTVDEKGVTEGKPELSYTSTDNTTVAFDFDLSKGSFDEVSKETYTYKWGEEEKETRYYLSYALMRDWTMYNYSVNSDTAIPAEVTDWTGKVLRYGSGPADQGLSFVKGYLNSAGKFYVGAFAEALKFGDMTGAVTKEGNKITVDLNKILNGALTQAITALDGVTAETTLGEVLALGPVYNFVGGLLNVVPLDMLLGAIPQVFGLVPTIPADIQQMVNGLINAVQPDENSSTYSYLVKLISSQELLNTANAFIEQMTGSSAIKLSQTLDKLSLGDVAGIVGMVSGMSSLDATQLITIAKSYLQSFTQMVQEDKLVIPSTQQYAFSETAVFNNTTIIKNLKLSFNYNSDYSVTGQTLTYDVESKTYDHYYNSVYEPEAPDQTQYEIGYTVSTQTMTMNLDYAESVTLEDFSKATVVESGYEFNNGTYNPSYNSMSNLIDCTVEVKDGKLVAVNFAVPESAKDEVDLAVTGDTTAGVVTLLSKADKSETLTIEYEVETSQTLGKLNTVYVYLSYSVTGDFGNMRASLYFYGTPYYRKADAGELLKNGASAWKDITRQEYETLTNTGASAGGNEEQKPSEGQGTGGVTGDEGQETGGAQKPGDSEQVQVTV